MSKSTKPIPPKLPKGAYRLPDDNYVVRRGRITAIHKDPPDFEKLARAFMWLAAGPRREQPQPELIYLLRPR